MFTRQVCTYLVLAFDVTLRKGSYMSTYETATTAGFGPATDGPFTGRVRCSQTNFVNEREQNVNERRLFTNVHKLWPTL